MTGPESHTSGLIDAIIVLRHVEVASSLRKGICVVRMRGSGHDQKIGELTVGVDGVVVGAPFDGLAGVLAGVATSST